jgi:hypothetical protein
MHKIHISIITNWMTFLFYAFHRIITDEYFWSIFCMNSLSRLTREHIYFVEAEFGFSIELNSSERSENICELSVAASMYVSLYMCWLFHVVVFSLHISTIFGWLILLFPIFFPRNHFLLETIPAMLRINILPGTNFPR